MAPTVVLAADNSDHSVNAFNWYVKNFHKPGINVHVLHVPEFVGEIQFMGSPSPATIMKLREDADKQAKEVNAKFSKLLQDSGVEGKVVVENGKDTWKTLVDYAKKNNAILIAMGTRGQGAIRRSLLGSVSDGVVHHSPIPVLICRDK